MQPDLEPCAAPPIHAPAAAPPLAFTAGSLLARWRSFAPTSDTTERLATWGFETKCLDGGCQASTIVYTVGIHGSETGLEVNAEGLRARSGKRTTSTLLWLDEHGHALRFQDHTHDLGWSAGPWSTEASQGPQQGAHEPGALSYEWTGSSGSLAGWKTAFVGVVGTAVLVGGWPRLRRWLWFSLYSRIERPRALEHPSRAQILDFVGQRPGIHFLELARQLEMSRGRLEHHLRKLEALGLVVRREHPGHTAFYVSRPDATLSRAHEATRAPMARALLELVRREPGLTTSRVAQELGLSISTVSYHSGRLRRAGLVEATRVGPEVRLRALPLAQDLLDPSLSKSGPAYS